MNELGMFCPMCRTAPTFALTDQAFCGNEECGLLCWQPSMTWAEFEAQEVHVIDLGTTWKRLQKTFQFRGRGRRMDEMTWSFFGGIALIVAVILLGLALITWLIWQV